MNETPTRPVSRPLSIETFSHRMERQLPVQDRLLLRLLQYPFSRAPDIEFALNLSRSTAYRHMMMAQDAGLTHSIYLGAYKNTICSYLSTRGIERVATLLEVDPTQLASQWEVGESGLLRLLPRLSTLIPLQALIQALLVQAPQRFATTGHPTQIHWHWVRDYQHAFTSKGKPQNLTMDAVLVFARKTMTAEEQRSTTVYSSAFLVLDPGWSGNHDKHLIQRRLEMVLRFRESQERWRQYRQFPPLLIVTPTDHQQRLWQNCAREAASHLRLTPLVGAVVSIPFADIMTLPSAWTLPWNMLGTGEACRLETLFQEMKRNALIPGVLAPRPMPECILPETASHKPVVMGRYEERAMALLATAKYTPIPPEDISSSLTQKKERETIALLSIALSQRHYTILQALYTHPLLSLEDLSALLDIQTSSVQRYLHDLRHTLCVRRISTLQGHRFHLVERGLRLMAASLHVSVMHLCEVRRTAEEQQQPLQQRGLAHLLRQITHTVGIYSFLTRFHVLAQQTPGHQLLWWETGAQCARRTFFDHAWHNLLPDAALAYRIDDRITYYWLEWDEGTMTPRNIAAKLHAYRRFVDARQWSQEYQHPPILLFIAPDSQQERQIAFLAERILKQTALVVSITTATRLHLRGPMHPIWLPILPIDPELADLPASDRPLPQRQGWTDLHAPQPLLIMAPERKRG